MIHEKAGVPEGIHHTRQGPGPTQKRQMHALLYTGEGRQEGLLAVANTPAMLLTPAPANTTRHTWLDCCSLLGRHTQALPAVTLRQNPSQHLAAPQYSIMQPKERLTMVTQSGLCLAGGRLIVSLRDNRKVSYQVSMTVSQWLASKNTPHDSRTQVAVSSRVLGAQCTVTLLPACYTVTTSKIPQHKRHSDPWVWIRQTITAKLPMLQCNSAVSSAMRTSSLASYGRPMHSSSCGIPGNTDKQAVAAVRQQQYA